MKQLIKIFLLSWVSMLILASCEKHKIYDFEDGWGNKSGDSTDVTVDTSMWKVDRSMYPHARIYPGMVGETEPRLTDFAVNLNMNFEDLSILSSNMRISVVPRAQLSTGLYAPAGELIKIVVPSDASGLTVQIGTQTDDLSNKPVLQRDAVLYTTQQLFPGTNYVRNLYGGTIFITALRSLGKTVTLNFTGAVKSPDFILGETDETAWKQAVVNSTVPWLELRSKWVIFTLPRDKFIRYPLNNPIAVMQAWDKVWEKDFYEWMGLSGSPADPRDKMPTLPWRIVVDIQPSAGYAHSGYPVVAQDDDNWFKEFTSLARIKGTGGGEGNWGAYHEIGHNCQQGSIWSWDGMGETSNNLFAFKVANSNSIEAGRRMLPTHPSIPQSFRAGLTFVKGADAGKDFSAISDPFEKILPFVQIYEKFGYGFMAYLYTESRHASHTANSDQDKRDFVYEKVCEYTGKNFLPFFQKWGIAVSNVSKNKMKALYAMLDRDIWNYNPLVDTGGTRSFEMDLDKSGWRVIAFDSYQSDDGGDPRVVLLDNNLTNYWHSQWNPQVAPPHYITIDMGMTEMVKGLYLYLRRSGSGVATAPNNCSVYVSNDGATYTLLTRWGTIAANQNRQEVRFATPQTFRYFKLQFEAADCAGSNVALAEIGGL